MSIKCPVIENCTGCRHCQPGEGRAADKIETLRDDPASGDTNFSVVRKELLNLRTGVEACARRIERLENPAELGGGGMLDVLEGAGQKHMEGLSETTYGGQRITVGPCQHCPNGMVVQANTCLSCGGVNEPEDKPEEVVVEHEEPEFLIVQRRLDPKGTTLYFSSQRSIVTDSLAGRHLYSPRTGDIATCVDNGENGWKAEIIRGVAGAIPQYWQKFDKLYVIRDIHEMKPEPAK